ncbi:MAG: double zinc ribbon domain-containing protein, partial [Pseudomonadales bacterium]
MALTSSKVQSWRVAIVIGVPGNGKKTNLAKIRFPSKLKGPAKTHLIMSTKYRKKVYQWLNYVQFGLLPGTCVICRKPTYRQLDLCLICESEMPLLKNPCRSYGLSLPPGYKGSLCETCIVYTPPWSLFSAHFY